MSECLIVQSLAPNAPWIILRLDHRRVEALFGSYGRVVNLVYDASSHPHNF